MTPSEFIERLAERRVYLSAAGDSLKYRAPKGAVDAALKEALGRFKGDLLKNIQGQEDPVLLSPLSYNQQSLFFMNLLEPRSPAYNLALTARLLPPVDAAKLKKSVERLVRRHGQLRTTFRHIEIGGEFVAVQLLHGNMPPLFEAVDAAGWTEEELAKRLQDFYRAPFDLERGPVVRAGLFSREGGGAVFALVVHHIIADAMSLNLIMRDLAAGYGGGPENAGSEAETEYVDFVLAQRRALEEPAGQGHLAFWLARLEPPAPPLELGDGSRRPPVRRSVGATHFFSLDASTVKSVERLAQERGITAFALCLAVFQWMLFDRSGRRDVTVGIPVMARGDRRFEDVVGYFVNPVPLRSRRDGVRRFGDHARLTAEELRSALDHRDAPLTAIVERLGGVRDPARTPAFQVMFNMLSRKTLGDVIDLLYPVEDAPRVDIGGLEAGAYPVRQQEGQFDLTLELIDHGGGMLGLLKYCTDLFSEAEAADMAAAYRTRLESVLADPEVLLFGSVAGDKAAEKPAADMLVSAVSASFTAEPIQEFLEFWFQRLGWEHDVRFAPYNQVFQELLDPTSLVRSNRRGLGIVMVRLDDMLPGGAAGLAGGPQGGDGRLAGLLEELRQAVTTAAQAMAVPLCFILCPSPPAGEEKLDLERRNIEGFLEALAALPGVVVLAPADVQARYPVGDYYEPLGETLGRIPFTRPYFAALATAAVRTLHGRIQKPIKALAVDCDGTLWKGVSAEDGATGVVIGPPQRAFQEFLLEQHKAGVILCLCSKNQEADVWAVFDRHPDMLLRREHFPFWKINWEAKSSNLRALAREINIGLDAVAFLDDSPLERAEVGARCPAVFCLEFPDAWEERTPWLRHVWALDHGAVTAEDRKRQEHYRSERLRENVKQTAGSLSEFLEKLELKIDLHPAGAADYDRLSQLSVRTNQFNTTTLRLTPQEVAAYAATPGLSAHVARVSDRFGDYGLVGGMLASAKDQIFRVDGMFLSCRALGRGVEFRMASYLAELARRLGCREIVFPVRTTERNEPARTFLSRLEGFCGGARDSENGLRLGAERLAGFHYDGLPPSEEESFESTAPREASETPDAAAALDRERSAAVAGELRSVDAILSAVEQRTRMLRSRMAPRVPSGPATLPRTAMEQVIADVWKRVLGLEEVNTQAKFFEVGGTSLLMAQIAIELNRDHGLAVSIMDMFQYPAIADLAGHLGGNGSAEDVASAAAASAARQRDALSSRKLAGGFKRLKKVRG